MDVLKKAVDAYVKDIFPTDKLITHRIPVTQINEGFQLLTTNPKEYIKGIITFN